MPYNSQFRAVNEIFVPVSRYFNIRPEEVRDYFGGKWNPSMDTTETISTSPSVAQRVERF